MSSGKCKLKQEMTAHLSEWPKSGTPTIPNAGKNLKTIGALIHCWWECKIVQLLEDTLLVSYKT